ncbi:homocysteine S-methyltransferase [Erwinia persicina]|jgi:homocysteine S-methyltransferase|uniref:Homocysteine S-methyltransferase n=1 Tax=Erwinia plantamica TaxID=3237104 RepID=A0ABW7CTV9_9GAMM|nr:homocysteine S-methyltransferase [Erwinia persicina]MCP1439971.1 homocysteine S-methyltransferase [Erwinia persicina]
MLSIDAVKQQVAAGLVLDGAMATELEARGCDLSDALWSAKVLIENPELIYQVHYDYFKAGAQVAITASYQATPQGFAQRGLDETAALALIARSVALAVKAREDYLAAAPQAGPLLVAGSVGPYGAFLADGSEYRGDYALPQAEMMAFHRPRVRALVAAGADILACETLPSFAEIKALIALLAEFPATPAWFSFTLRDSEHLSDGTPLAEVIAFLDAQPQAVALGINCIALDKVTAALKVFSALSAKPLVVYPNSGEQYDAVSKSWHSDASTCTLADNLAEWQAAGARLIGGCCRTTPADIKAIAQRCR